MNTTTAPERMCPKCHAPKPATEYARHTERGRQHWCRACMTQARREWRERLKTREPYQWALTKLADALRKRKARNEQRLAGHRRTTSGEPSGSPKEVRQTDLQEYAKSMIGLGNKK